MKRLLVFVTLFAIMGAVYTINQARGEEICDLPCRAMVVTLEEVYSGLKEAGDFDTVEVIGCDPKTKDIYVFASIGEKSAYTMVPYDKDCKAGEPQLVTDFDRVKELLKDVGGDSYGITKDSERRLKEKFCNYSKWPIDIFSLYKCCHKINEINYEYMSELEKLKIPIDPFYERRPELITRETSISELATQCARNFKRTYKRDPLKACVITANNKIKQLCKKLQ